MRLRGAVTRRIERAAVYQRQVGKRFERVPIPNRSQSMPDFVGSPEKQKMSQLLDVVAVIYVAVRQREAKAPEFVGQVVHDSYFRN